MKCSFPALTLIFISGLFLFSCNKQVEDTATGTVSIVDCQMNVSNLYSNDLLVEKAAFTYNKDTLTSIDVPIGYETGRYTFQYDVHGNLVRRNFFSTSAPDVLEAYTTISYNDDGTMAKYETFSSDNNTDVPDHRTEFTYAGGKLVHFVSSYLNYDGSSLEKDLEYMFQYKGSNISADTKITYNPDNTDTTAGVYYYDNDSSYLARFGLKLLITDPAFEEGGGDFIAALVGANNPVRYDETTKDGPGTYHFVYTPDDKKNIKEVRITDDSGDVNFRFTYGYLCQ